MTGNTEVDRALHHVRTFGGNSTVRAILADALEPNAIRMKHELRAINLGCGDDRVATNIENTLKEGGWTLSDH